MVTLVAPRSSTITQSSHSIFTISTFPWKILETNDAMEGTESGAITDLFGGREDLSRRVIRCVGEPETRFREDALRMLRAYRFAAQLGFSLDA